MELLQKISSGSASFRFTGGVELRIFFKKSDHYFLIYN